MEVIGFDIAVLAGLWVLAAMLMSLLLAFIVRVAVVPTIDAVTRARRTAAEQRLNEGLATRLAAIDGKLEELARAVRASSGSGEAGFPSAGSHG